MNAAALTIGLFVLVGLASPLAQAQDPVDAYKAYLAAFAKAEQLQFVLPFYTKELRTGLARMPQDQQKNYMAMQVGKHGLKDLKVTNRQVDGGKTVLEMTALTADGQAVSGSATLVKEGTEWKIDDEAWALPAPPKAR